MRFMMLMIPAGYATATSDTRPKIEAIKRMREYNLTLQQAGILLALDGLHPPAAGARITTVEGKPNVIDGPFAESKEVVGGYWMLDVSSRDEAIVWATRCPLEPGDTIEVRQVFEIADFPADVQKLAEGFND